MDQSKIETVRRPTTSFRIKSQILKKPATIFLSFFIQASNTTANIS